MLIMPIWDLGFYMQIVCAALLEENRKIIRFFKRNSLDEVGYIVTVLWDIFIWVLYVHFYGFYSIISAILSIKLVTRITVKTVVMVYKREWSWGKWYETSLRLVHVTPYQQMGIRL